MEGTDYGNGLIVPKDELTPLERSKLMDEGKEVDRIQACLDTGETLAPMIGVGVDEYYHSAEKMVELEEYLYDTFHGDGAGLSTTLRGMAEAMGAEISYAKNRTAQLKTPALKLKEIDQAKLVDVDKDGRLPIVLDALAQVKKKLGDRVPVSGTVTGPFTVAAMVLGTEWLLVGMLKCPDKIKQLMDVIVENNNRYIQRMIDLEVGIGFADPVSSTDLISPEQYREFSLPYFQKNVDFIKKQGRGCGLHICGTSRKLWEDLAKTGIGLFGLDNVESLVEAKEVLGPHMAIQGKVPPVDILNRGTPMDVLMAAKESIRDGFDNPGGFVLTSGCQTPLGTPIENMHALIDGARIFGRTPIKREDLM
ncbi:MAG: uroporphyrinogen decarboxylase family protein [Lachnospiraceae bacterium]|nr:uroporphyrinogen decarboxylase family protein [Lachnospiraceae bacterium]